MISVEQGIMIEYAPVERADKYTVIIVNSNSAQF